MPGLVAAASRTPAAAPAFPPTTPSPPRPQHVDPAAVLTFADVSDELFRLQPIDGQHTTAAPASGNASHSPQNLPAAPQQPPQRQLRTSSSNSSLTAQPQAAASHSPHTRRPSPGLAARLKALGFGTSRKASPPPAHRDHVGRLPEDQLRQLEQSHQSGLSATAVERRGRPWKGAIARMPSRASLRSSKSVKTHDDEAGEPAPKTPAGAPDTRPPSEFLPAIEPSTPFDMDTHKYRLPDHTNGNGTKVTLDTRREHLERDTRPPYTPDLPPPPPPKDTPPRPASAPAPAPAETTDPDPSSYFNPLGLQRPGSIYTISRASFAVQLAQLTSLQLPDAESLSSRVAAIPTAQAASRALIGAAEQIRSWISKASEVIGGLDSEDDVEWAAAGGREGLEEVEQAIARFEELINVYVGAIEDLQRRDDIAGVPTDDLTKAVVQMEAILDEWSKIRATLQTVKGQVEIAMEWEELWNMVLGDIQNEMDDLTRLVFEMEERRHKSVMAIASGEGVDIGDLETIVEEGPPAAARLQANRFSLPAFPVSPSSPGPTISQDDSSLLALFARMQPLRASLDFLPMRLSVFEARAQGSFPTACEELEMRRAGLDASYKKLEKDAESLRKELGEDRWVLVFRGAGRQAQKMVESVERTVAKLREAADAGTHLTNQPVMAKKIESYEAKKTHYGPAIERVLSIIDRGVKDRLTVNGEILRLHGELQTKWEDVRGQLRDMDAALEELQAEKKGQQLRDSVSSMLSNDRSTTGSGAETPGSSPPSSVIMASLGLERAKPAAKAARGRVSSGAAGTHLPQPPPGRRAVSATTSAHLPRKPASRLSSGVASPSREGSATPTGGHRGGLPRPASTVPGKPRWNASTNTTDIDTGHNFKPLSATDRSPYTKTTPTPARPSSALAPAHPSASSKLPTRSPGLRAASSSPGADDPTPSRRFSRLSFRERIASPGPHAQQQPPAPARPRLNPAASAPSTLGDRRASLQPARPSLEESSRAAPRPSSSLASSRRLSMLPQPRHGKGGGVTGRESPQAVAGARPALKNSTSTKGGESKDNKPRWRA